MSTPCTQVASALACFRRADAFRPAVRCYCLLPAALELDPRRLARPYCSLSPPPRQALCPPPGVRLSAPARYAASASASAPLLLRPSLSPAPAPLSLCAKPPPAPVSPAHCPSLPSHSTPRHCLRPSSFPHPRSSPCLLAPRPKPHSASRTSPVRRPLRLLPRPVLHRHSSFLVPRCSLLAPQLRPCIRPTSRSVRVLV